MIPTILNLPPKLDSIHSIRPPSLQGFSIPPLEVSFDDAPHETSLAQLSRKPCFKNAFLALKDIIYSFENFQDLDAAKALLSEFKEASTELSLCHIPIVHRFYFHIWHINKSANEHIHGDQWGEIHAFDDPCVFLKALKTTLRELLPLKILEELDRLESPINKAKTKSLSLNLSDLPQEYLELFDRYLVFFQDPANQCQEAIPNILEKIRITSPSWAQRKRTIQSACEEAHDHPLYSKSLFWVTGSNTHSLAGVLKAIDIDTFENTASLVPTGLLLKEGIAPLSGELGDGISEHGVNQNHLSGVLAEAYSGALMYAKQADFYFDKDESLAILFKYFSDLSKTSLEAITIQDLFKLKIFLIRAYEYAELPSESLVHIQARLSTWTTKDSLHLKPKSFLINDLIPFLKSCKRSTLSPELTSIISKKAEALIYGISEESDEMHALINRRIRGDVRLETSLKGPLKLGDHIDFAITSSKESASVLNSFLPFKVLSFEAGVYLLSRQGKTE